MSSGFTHTIALRQRFPLLARSGIAAESFAGFRSDGVMHGHDVVEVALILAGTGHHRLDDIETPLRPGSLVIVGFGQIHGYRTPAGPLDLVNAYLDPQAVPPPVVDTGPAPAVLVPLHPGLVHRRNRVSYLDADDEVRLALAGLARETARGGAASVAALRAWYGLFLTAATRRLVPPASVVGGVMEDLRRHLDDRAAVNHPLPDLARRCRMTVPALCRAFKRHTGRTVVGYLHQRRIEQALRLLGGTDDRVTDISLAVGFTDLSQFHRVFRRIVGISPGRWRRHRGGGPASAAAG